MLIIQSRFPRIDSISLGGGVVVGQIHHPFEDIESRNGLNVPEQQHFTMFSEDSHAQFRAWQVKNERREELQRQHIDWEAETWSIYDQESLAQYEMTYEVSGGPGSSLACVPDAPLPVFMSIRGLMYADGLLAAEEELEAGDVTGFVLSGDGKRVIASLEVWEDSALLPKSRLITYQFEDQAQRWKQVARWTSEDRYFSTGAFFPDGNRILLLESPHDRHFSFDSNHPALYSVGIATLTDLQPRRILQMEVEPGSLGLCDHFLWATYGPALEVRSLYNLGTSSFILEFEDPDLSLAVPVADVYGRFLLLAEGDEIQVWDPKTWTITKTYCWKAGAITCLAVAPDGLTAAAGTNTGKVVIWDMD